MKYPLWHFAMAAAVAIAFPACAAPIAARRTPFNEADFASTRGAGSGSVTGQAFITMKDNKTQVAANVGLVLLPVNAYTTETIQRKYEGGENLAEGDSRYFKYVRAASADSQGNFAFRQLPAGDYYVGANVLWSYWIWNTNADGSMYKSTIRRSTRIYARVSVKNGQTVRIGEWSQGKSILLNPFTN